MSRYIDETGHRYGRLTVLEKAPKKTPKERIKWRCQCDCGTVLDVYGTSLRNGNTKSCGCLQRDRARESNIKRAGGDLTGKRFDNLIVLKFLKMKETSDGKQERVWLCQCDCGNQVERTTQSLNRNTRHSCGCKISEIISKNTVKREEGNKYGLLTVESEFGRNENGRVLWKCKCECGNTKIALGKSLRAGLVKSCGCLHSSGEQKIAEILNELKIPFYRQQKFNDLKSDTGNFLYFDFFLPDNNICIEYQGEQHYYYNGRGWNNEENFIKTQKRDALKRQYCLKKGITLIEIPYTDYSKMNKKYFEEVLKCQKSV